MNEAPFKNNEKETVFIAGKMIPPGETRFIPANMVPGYTGTEVAPVEVSDPLLDHLDKSIAEIAELFPLFTDEELDRLEQAEDNGLTRKGLKAAFAEERLERSAKLQEATEFLEQDEEAIAAALDGENVKPEDITYLVGLEAKGQKREELLKLMDEKIQAAVEAAAE
jgi:hypothetical protein